jgi:putative tryptophan/tyrosine transport system substrate-binding protein
MILRVALTVVLALGVLAAPLTTSGQPAARVPRVGSLLTVVNPGTRSALSADLWALGYVAGRTIILEERYAEGRVDRLPALAAELVQLNVDVIVAWGPEPLEAVRKATSRIPIVMVAGGDPVATGLAASLAKPGRWRNTHPQRSSIGRRDRIPRRIVRGDPHCGRTSRDLDLLR